MISTLDLFYTARADFESRIGKSVVTQTASLRGSRALNPHRKQTPCVDFALL